MSHIAVIGTGYVGLTTAACWADLGNEVCGVDADTDVIKNLRKGTVPFFEPGLQEVVQRNLAAGRLRFTTSYEESIPGVDFIVIAVGTPMAANGEADLRAVREAAASVARHLAGPVVIVNKSTVPIGTGDVVTEIISANLERAIDFSVVANPEFLREGSAIHDFMDPDRIVLGAHDAESAAKVAELYKPLDAPVLITNPYTAEMIKYASNAFLATKISFINEVARICEKLDADVRVVAKGMGMDHRIGDAFLEAGTGYGGSCFPKDVMALARTSESIGAHPQMLRAVMDINRGQPLLLLDKLHGLMGPLRGQTVAVLGLAFKPNTDDMREAPSVQLITALLKKGVTVRAYDPAAMARARRLLPEVKMQRDAYSAARGADALVIMTEWNEFRLLDLVRLKKTMKRPVIVDGRNIYEPAEMTALGFVYKGVGR
jgi:UDPglucose 6-dehydrogenase